MKSMIRYGLFAGALALAVLLGHIVTARSYAVRGDEVRGHDVRAYETKVAKGLLQHNDSTETQDAPVLPPKLNGDLARDKNTEPTKHAGQAKPSAINNRTATALEPAAALQMTRLKENRPAVKMPEIQHPNATKKDFVEIGSTQNASAGQSRAALPEIDAGPTVAAGEPDTLNNRGKSTESYSHSFPPFNRNVLSILSPLLTLDGKPLDNIEGKTLLLAVWATWCGACQQQLSNFDELVRKLDNPALEVIVLAVDTDPVDIRRFIASRPIHYPIVILDSDSAEQLQIDAVPTTLMVNSRGKLRVRIKGYAENLALYEQKLTGVLAEAKSAEAKPAAEKPAAEKPANVIALTGGQAGSP